MKKAEKRQYPRDVWVLTPAYAVKKVAVVKRANTWSGLDCGDRDEKGKLYRVGDMHATKQEAIDYGRRQIVARREYLAKQEALLDKRAEKLEKAEQEGAIA